MIHIDSLLSARLFLSPQHAGDKLYFISNLSGHLSLYAMQYSGSIPEPLLPPGIALQNPHLIEGYPYYIFPGLDVILVMIDADGDENYQPSLIPMDGGFPEPSFGNFFSGYRVHLVKCDQDQNLVYLSAESRREQMNETFQGNLTTGRLEKIGASPWGADPRAVNNDHTQVVLVDNYTLGDAVLYLWSQEGGERKLLFGTPLESRIEGQAIPPNGIDHIHFVPGGRGLLVTNAIDNDCYDLGYLDLANPERVQPVSISGTAHAGSGELVSLDHLEGNRFTVGYNIDGCSWLYQGRFDERQLHMEIEQVLVGQGFLSNGVLESCFFDKYHDCFSLSFSTATSPTQIYSLEGQDHATIRAHTNERILGIRQEFLSIGEQASYTSFDGTRVSARLYLPAEKLGFQRPFPLIYYVHGGPQSQERPDFAWFSMPLIQFLTLNGFAVFVPNVRGSTGYGLSYTKQVDRDWGGKDRLDHVHAMQEVLPKDKRLDCAHSGVVGRSYGGYMSLMLAARHPGLWSAAVDMFGPYDLFTFMDRIPETWKPYFAIAVGDPAKDKDFLVERSPRTYMDQIECPLLVIQGKNDPRVVERESRDLVEYLRSKGKQVEYLVFENEGHDVLKHENRVTCYNAITDFFRQHLSS